AAVGGKSIGLGKDARQLRGFQGSGERVGRVGAGIDGGFAVDTAQTPVALGIGGDAVVVLAAIGAGNEMFAAILDPAHRVAAMHGEPAETNLFRQQDALVANPAANVRRDDADLALVKAETLGQSGSHDVRHLTSRVYRQLLEPRVPEADNAATFDRRDALPSGADLARDLDRRIHRLADID